MTYVELDRVCQRAFGLGRLVCGINVSEGRRYNRVDHDRELFPDVTKVEGEFWRWEWWR